MKLNTNSRLGPGVALLVILVVASLFRLWQIDGTPPGLMGDEAVNGLEALDVLEGRGAVFFPTNYGREGLFMYILAAAFKVLGVEALAIHLVTAITGIATVLATFWLGRELFRSATNVAFRLGAPILAALWLAGAYWHVHYSRFGVRVIPVPLFGALAFAAFWRGRRFWKRDLERGSNASPQAWVWFVLSGIFLGLSTHFYSVSRLYPVFLGLFLLVQAVVARVSRDEKDGSSPLLQTLFWPTVVVFASAAVVFAPLGWYYVTHAGSLTQRAAVVSVFGQEAPWAALGQSLAGNLAQFFLPGRGHPSATHNLPGRPLLEPLTFVLTATGLLVALRRSRKPEYLFLVLWLIIMPLPAILTADANLSPPTRLIGVLPGLYFFPAIAVVTLAEWVQRRRLEPRLAQILAATLFIVPLASAMLLTARDYFVRWAPSAEAFEHYEGEAVNAARWLRANRQSWPVYVSAEFYRHMSFMLLYSQTPASEMFTVRDETIRWFDGRSSLPLPPPPTQGTYVFIGIAHPDGRWLDRYLPDREVVYQELAPLGEPSFTVVRARGMSRPHNLTEQRLTEEVVLAGYEINGEARPGHPFEVVLHWRLAAPKPEDEPGYRIELVAVDSDDNTWPIGTSHFSFRPPEWDAGSGAVSWQQALVPGEASPGRFTLGVRLLDDRDGRVVSEWVTLSSSNHTTIQPDQPLATFGEGLRLLDTEVMPTETDAGASLTVALTLDTTSPQPQSYSLFLHVLDANGQRLGQRDGPTGGGLFPTDGWQPDQPIRDTYHIPITGKLGTAAAIAVGFYDWRTGDRLPAMDSEGRLLQDGQFLMDLD